MRCAGWKTYGWDVSVKSSVGIQPNGLLTKLVQHVRDILPVDGAIAVPIQDLEPISQRPDLRRL